MASKTARRDAGAGSLYEDARGLWTAVVELPPGPDGQRRRKVRRDRTKPGAAAKLKKLLADLEKSGDLPTSSPTMAQWTASWLAARKRTLKPSTWKDYEKKIRLYVVPTIGRQRLDRLSPDHVRRVHDYILDELGLASTTALGAHRVLAKCLTDAERQGRISKNVATLLDAPPKGVGTRGALSAEQARTLLLSVAGDPVEAVHWSLALLAGLRQGERLGLTLDEIELERVDDEGRPTPTITVAWQLQRLAWEHGCGPAPKTKGDSWPCERKRAGSCPDRKLDVPADQEAQQVHGGLWMTRPKSRAGWREVPLPPGLAEVMRRHLEAVQPGMAGLVLHRGDGRPVDPSDDSKAWHAALVRAGLPAVPLHAARHTTATLLHSLGVSSKTREQILGHSSATVTAGYTHVSGPEMVEAMGRLGGLLESPA